MLISLEGIDGSGKTTVWESLQDEFDEAVFTREPTTETFYGDAVLESLNRDDSDSLAELFLYLADHAAHLSDTVRPALNNGQPVISDRYIDSRFAYQAVSLEERFPDSLSYVQSLHDQFTILPDLTIFIDVPPEVAVERSDKANKFEQQQHLEKVRDQYERIISQDTSRFYRVDGTQPPETVRETVVEVIENELR